ncbi:MAG: RIP metalloprotease RseP [Cellvibrionaceae bacterium]
MMTVLWFLLALGILVTFHEYGHFYVARRCGVKVLRFSVGFGKPLYTWVDRHGTEFTLAAIPLGGYVKMLDEREGEVAAEELPNAFTQKSVWQRMAIVVAGPIANFILAIVFYFVLALIGIKGLTPVIGEVEEGSLAAQAKLTANEEIVSIDEKRTPTWSAVYERLTSKIGDTGKVDFEVRLFSGDANSIDATRVKSVELEQWLKQADQPDLLKELGLSPYQPKTDWIIKQVVPGGAAEKAGIQVGDKLLSADGQTLHSWGDWVKYVQARPEKPIELDISREGSILTVELMPEAVKQSGSIIGKVGLGASTEWPEGMLREIDYSFSEAIAYGFTKTGEQALVILSFLKKLILLDVSVKNMGGTFTIAQVAGDTASAGFTYYLSFLAFFSVSLGVFNLLPIPVLDGGHLLFYVVEAIKGKPLPEKIQLVGYQIGLFIVVSVMVVAHYNDIMRILS